MRLTRLAAAGSALLLPACSFSFSVGGPDYGALETAIRDDLVEVLAEVPVDVGEVTCPRPSPAPDVGDRFTCTADLGEAIGDMRVEATVEEGGDIGFRSLDRVFEVPATAAAVAGEISAQAGFEVVVDCGEGLQLLALGSELPCTATDPLGEARGVVVTVTESGASWVLEP